MGRKQMRRARSAAGVFSAAALLLGAAVFTLLAVWRWKLRPWFPAEPLLGYVLIAAVWCLEALCAVFRLLFFPGVKPAKFFGQNGAGPKRPYDCMALALSCLEHGDRAEALAVLEKVDAGRLKKRGLARLQELRRLASGGEPDPDLFAGALYRLSEDLRKDAERLERRHAPLGSLPRAALLSLLLLAAMRYAPKELPSRCAELRFGLCTQSEGETEELSLLIRSEAAPQGSPNEAAATLSYQSWADGQIAAAAENELFFQFPAPEAPGCDRIVYTPRSLMDPERYELPFPDTAGFESLRRAAAKAVAGLEGEESAWREQPCRRLQGQLPAGAVEGVLRYAAGLLDPALYLEEPVWAGTPAGTALDEIPGGSSLPLTVWADGEGSLLAVSVDLSPLFPGFPLSKEEPPCIALSFFPYDPGFVALPETGGGTFPVS